MVGESTERAIPMDLGWLPVCGRILAGHGPLPLALFLAGLGGSVTHCLVMCSVFVIGQAPAVADKGGLARLLLPYHLGRITTYTVLGVLAGAGFHLVARWSGFGVLRRLVLAVVAMVFLAALAERLLRPLRLSLPFSIALPRLCDLPRLKQLAGISSASQRYSLGLSLGLLPCPLVLAALMAAGTSASPAVAALSMAAFGLGTLPALLGLAFASSNLLRKSPRLQDGLTLAALGINGVILLGLAAG